MDKLEKNHHFWAFSGVGTSTKKSVPVPNALVWTSVSILAITWSFIIRFE